MDNRLGNWHYDSLMLMAARKDGTEAATPHHIDKSIFFKNAKPRAARCGTLGFLNAFGGSVPLQRSGEQHITLSVSANEHDGTAGSYSSEQAAKQTATEQSDGRRKKGGGWALEAQLARKARPLSLCSAFCASLKGCSIIVIIVRDNDIRLSQGGKEAGKAGQRGSLGWWSG